MNYDYVVLRYDLYGNIAGTIRYDDPYNGTDVITSIVAEDSSNIYVSGFTYGNTQYYNTTQRYTSLAPVGIQKGDINSGVKIFPNPFTEKLQISFANFQGEDFTFRLLDAAGKLLMTQLTSQAEIQLTGIDLPAGFYSFMLFSRNSIYYGKIVKIE